MCSINFQGFVKVMSDLAQTFRVELSLQGLAKPERLANPEDFAEVLCARSIFRVLWG